MLTPPNPPEKEGTFLPRMNDGGTLSRFSEGENTMHRHYHGYRGGLRRPGLPPLGRPRLLSSLLVGGLGYMLGRQQSQNQYQPQYRTSQPQPGTQSDQLAQLKLLGQLRESGVLTEEEFQAQKQKILQ
jgi:hypothetical protein